MSEISGNQTVQCLANTVSEVGALNQTWLFFRWHIDYIWFGIVMLKINWSFFDDLSLQFIEFIHGIYCDFSCISSQYITSFSHHQILGILFLNLVLESALVFDQILATVVSYYLVNITSHHSQWSNFSVSY